ncbi:MAG: Uncharacterised protein [Methanobacteriota archaeon]|nr:MAG: Uncharacterised protein [Euryarchaeota archaeon]
MNLMALANANICTAPVSTPHAASSVWLTAAASHDANSAAGNS